MKKEKETIEKVEEEAVAEVKENAEITSEVVEEKVEEVPAVEEKVFYKPVEIESDESLYTALDNNQKTFSTYYDKVKKISSTIMVIFMVAIIAFLLFGGTNGTSIGLSVVLVVVYFICISTYSKKTKEKLNNDSLKVLNEYFTLVDSFVTSNEVFTEVEFNREYKLEEDTFASLKICKDIISVIGRDLIKGKLSGYDFVAGDNCIKTREKDEEGKEKDFIVFLGKLFVINIPNLINEGRAVIYLKGKGANGPTDIADLTKVEGLLSEKYDVYSSFDVGTLLTDEVKSLLETFEVNDTLVDMFISINEKGVSFGFSYSDGVMVVPLTDPLDKNAIAEYKKNVELMVEIVKILGK